MKITLPGVPIPKARPRFFKTKKGIRAYDSQKDKTRIVRQKIFRLMQIANQIHPPFNFALTEPYFDYYHVSLRFYFPVPIRDSKAIKKAKLEGSLKATIKFDLDNLEKFVLDAMTGIVYQDDKQVVSLSSEKFYSEEPRTEIEVQGFFYGKTE